MHAVIKIVCFLVFGAMIATGDIPVLLAGLALLIPLYVIKLNGQERIHAATAIAMLKRLRWLFLSIFIVYLFFTPGVLLFSGVLWGPTEEGVLLGLSRIMVLVLIVAAVNVLLISTGQLEFFAAVHWCLRPLAWIGVPHERLAVRIALTLETVSTVREAFRNESRDLKNNNSAQHSTLDSTLDSTQDSTLEPTRYSTWRSKLMAISDTAHRLFAQVIAEGEATPLREIVLPDKSRPPVMQWGIPLVLASVLWMVKNHMMNWV